MEKPEEAKISPPDDEMGAWFKKWFEDFGDWLKRGFSLYQKNFLLLIQVSAIVFILSTITAGLLWGPLMVGCYLLSFKLIDNIKPDPTWRDTFVAFKHAKKPGTGMFWNALYYYVAFALACVVVHMAVYAILGAGFWGGFFAYLIVLALHTVILFGLPFIAEKDMDFTSACAESLEMVKKAPVHFFIYSSIAVFAAAIGLIALYVGVVFTLPLYFCIIAAAFREQVPREGLLEKLAREQE